MTTQMPRTATAQVTIMSLEFLFLIKDVNKRSLTNKKGEKKILFNS